MLSFVRTHFRQPQHPYSLRHHRSSEGWFYHERIADSGAGRPLESRDALVEQGIPEKSVHQHDRTSYNPRFLTGIGMVDSGPMLGSEGLDFGSNAAYFLDNCIKSFGEVVETKSKCKVIWGIGRDKVHAICLDPREAPDVLARLRACADNALHADRVEGNVPIFREQVRFIPPSSNAMRGLISDARKAKPIPRIPAYAPSPRMDECIRCCACSMTQLCLQTLPQEAVILIPRCVARRLRSKHLRPLPNHQVTKLRQRRRLPSLKQATSLEHRPIGQLACPRIHGASRQQSSMYQQRVTKKRLDPLADRGGFPTATQFGERIATDYIIPSEKDPAVHVIRDEFSVAMPAFVGSCAADRSTQNLLTFVGVRYKELPRVFASSMMLRSSSQPLRKLDGFMKSHLRIGFPVMPN